MSQENVERACRFIEHVNRTGELGPDFDSVFHPEMEFEDEIGAYHTRDEVRAFLQGFAEAIGGLHLEVEETSDLGDVIMLVVQQSGRGSVSGVPIAQPFTWVMRFANDRCVRWRIYADHGRALEDAGLSEENVEIVRQAVEAFNARDRDQLLGLMDPEIEFLSVFERKTYRGRAGMLQYREDIDATLEGFHTEDSRFLDAGDERVVYLYRIVGRGTGSGVPVSRENAILWQLRAGKLLKGEVYLDQRQALEAAGLSE